MAGDGTTTATVLAQSILNEGLKSVAAGMNPMDLKRGVDKAVAALVSEVSGLSSPAKILRQLLKWELYLRIPIVLLAKSSPKRWKKSARRSHYRGRR